jgi:hypothetical protein
MILNGLRVTDRQKILDCNHFCKRTTFSSLIACRASCGRLTKG